MASAEVLKFLETLHKRPEKEVTVTVPPEKEGDAPTTKTTLELDPQQLIDAFKALPGEPDNIRTDAVAFITAIGAHLKDQPVMYGLAEAVYAAHYAEGKSFEEAFKEEIGKPEFWEKLDLISETDPSVKNDAHPPDPAAAPLTPDQSAAIAAALKSRDSAEKFSSFMLNHLASRLGAPSVHTAAGREATEQIDMNDPNFLEIRGNVADIIDHIQNTFHGGLPTAGALEDAKKRLEQQKKDYESALDDYNKNLDENRAKGIPPPREPDLIEFMARYEAIGDESKRRSTAQPVMAMEDHIKSLITGEHTPEGLTEEQFESILIRELRLHQTGLDGATANGKTYYSFEYNVDDVAKNVAAQTLLIQQSGQPGGIKANPLDIDGRKIIGQTMGDKASFGFEVAIKALEHFRGIELPPDVMNNTTFNPAYRDHYSPEEIELLETVATKIEELKTTLDNLTATYDKDGNRSLAPNPLSATITEEALRRGGYSEDIITKFAGSNGFKFYEHHGAQLLQELLDPARKPPLQYIEKLQQKLAKKAGVTAEAGTAESAPETAKTKTEPAITDLSAHARTGNPVLMYKLEPDGGNIIFSNLNGYKMKVPHDCAIQRIKPGAEDGTIAYDDAGITAEGLSLKLYGHLRKEGTIEFRTVGDARDGVVTGYEIALKDKNGNMVGQYALPADPAFFDAENPASMMPDLNDNPLYEEQLNKSLKEHGFDPAETDHAALTEHYNHASGATEQPQQIAAVNEMQNNPANTASIGVSANKMG